MIGRNIKSIAYYLSGKGLFLCQSSEDRFILYKKSCLDCGALWDMGKTECYICGSRNYFVYTCPNCQKLFSLTNAPKTCDVCNIKLHKMCLNQECYSNVNTEFRKVVNGKGGIFHKESGMRVALTHCLECGGRKNIYKPYQIKIHFINNTENIINIEEFKESWNYSQDEIFILKVREGNNRRYLIGRTINYRNVNEINYEECNPEIDLTVFD